MDRGHDLKETYKGDSVKRKTAPISAEQRTMSTQSTSGDIRLTITIQQSFVLCRKMRHQVTVFVIEGLDDRSDILLKHAGRAGDQLVISAHASQQGIVSGCM